MVYAFITMHLSIVCPTYPTWGKGTWGSGGRHAKKIIGLKLHLVSSASSEGQLHGGALQLICMASMVQSSLINTTLSLWQTHSADARDMSCVCRYGIPCKTKISNSKYQVQKQNIKFKSKNIKFI
jgi:hypothetical protein